MRTFSTSWKASTFFGLAGIVLSLIATSGKTGAFETRDPYAYVGIACTLIALAILLITFVRDRAAYRVRA